MKVLLTRPFFAKDIQYIRERIDNSIELVIPNSYDDDTLVSLVSDCEVLLGPYLSESLLSASKNVRLIQIPWTGVDSLNFSLLSNFAIPIANSHSNAGIVAEHAIALMFDATKKVAYHDQLMRKGVWNRPGSESNKIDSFSIQVAQSKVALIGFGSIGKKIHQYLSGLNCNFNVFNRSGEGQEFDRVKYYPINDLNRKIAESNIVFVCVALTESTRNLLNDDFFENLNPNTILINVARGEVIDEDSLFKALKSNDRLFAGIDTWYKYPTKDMPNVFPSSKNNFHELDNIIMSPHRAGMISDSLPHLDDAIENLNRLANNLSPINIISIENKY